jgi:hypothetical protein
VKAATRARATLTEAPEKMSNRSAAMPAVMVAHSATTHSICTPMSAASWVIASMS